MLELILAASLLAAVVAGLSWRRPLTGYSSVPRVRIAADDLPCPWCRAQTDEADDRCHSCGRAFG